MKEQRMLSASQFLTELQKHGGSCSRSGLLRRWRNGNMTAAHLDALIKETGCVVIEEASTGGRPKTMVLLDLPKTQP